MNSEIRITLNTTPEQHARLLALQRTFAEVCNALAPVVQQTRTWNRVALHHLAYKSLRERFPALGSQMVCNAIYSVSRTCRLVFQTPGSPLHHTRLAGQPLPTLRFLESSPVYFDRHTLSIRNGQASMYTLDGRMKFQLTLQAEHEQAFHQRKLLEIVLQRGAEDRFELRFVFGEALPSHPALQTLSASDAPEPSPPEAPAEPQTAPTAPTAPPPIAPAYVRVEEAHL